MGNLDVYISHGNQNSSMAMAIAPKNGKSEKYFSRKRTSLVICYYEITEKKPSQKLRQYKAYIYDAIG